MSRTKYDWSMLEWRDYYMTLRARAWDNYQSSGEPRYDREYHKYDVIVDAMNGYLTYKDDQDAERTRRQRNITMYAEKHLYKSDYTQAEVRKMLDDIKWF